MIRTRTYWPYYLAALACALFFVILVNERIDGRLVAFDRFIYYTLQQIRTSWLDTILITVTQLGDTLMVTTLTAIVTLWLAIKKSWRTCCYWLLTIISSSVINTAIKVGVGRTRPGDMLYSGWSAFSFPSGHTTANIVLYGMICLLLYPCLEKRTSRLLTILCTIGFALLIAGSRLYLGAHWFSDVLAGMLISTFILCIAGALYYAGQPDEITAKDFLIPVLSALLIVGSIHVWRGWHFNLKRYNPAVITESSSSHTRVPVAPVGSGSTR